jgi:hypothetical protein
MKVFVGVVHTIDSRRVLPPPNAADFQSANGFN